MIAYEHLMQVPEWFSGSGPDADTVISSRIRLARNLSGHLFPGRASLQQRETAYGILTDACRKVPACRKLRTVHFTRIKEMAQRFLVEERLVSPDLVKQQGERGVAAGDGVALMFNEEDHVRLQVIGPGSCAGRLWETADALDTALGKKVDYAYDPTRGFLTACPTNSGTGLRVSFLLHLPGLVLTKTIDQVLQAASHMGISTRGFFGEYSDIVGNFFQLSNQATMGATEKEFIDTTAGMVRQVVTLERQARQRILKEARAELEDKVYRACGILRYARSLGVDEFLNLASAVRTGVETGLFGGTCVGQLNRLTLLVMPAHMQTLYGRAMDDGEIRLRRAEIVRDFLKESSRP